MKHKSVSDINLMVDTNVFVDFLCKREPFYHDARLLMAIGFVGELSLWICASQMTDLVYIITEGGKPKLIPEALEQLRKLRAFVKVANVDSDEIDEMLSTDWADVEDALLHQVAMSVQADCIVSRNVGNFEKSTIPVMDCEQLFAWIEDEYGFAYASIEDF